MPLSLKHRDANRMTCGRCLRDAGAPRESGTVWRCRVDGEPIGDHARSGACPLEKLRPTDLPEGAKPTSAPPVEPWEVRGPKLWAELHRAATAGELDEKWLTTFRGRIGCGTCIRDWMADVAANPLTPDDQVGWAWARHEAVNRKLGKIGIPLANARAKA